MRIAVEHVIPASPVDVWKVAGDVGAVSDWVPAIESSHLEGDIRHATFADGGGDARERIVTVDDDGHSYTYEYLDGPLPLDSYVSTFSVLTDPAGSRITWVAEFSAAPDLERELETGIVGIYSAALEELTARFPS